MQAAWGNSTIAHGSSANFFRFALSDVLTFIARRQASFEVHYEKKHPHIPHIAWAVAPLCLFASTAQAAPDFGVGT
jgi:hypothetical protein